MNLSKPRMTLLRTLVANGGKMDATQLTVPDRRLATRMQSDGLVQWHSPAIQSRHTCIGQWVTITESGCGAVRRADAKPHPQCPQANEAPHE
jgi:hypothetical protein